MDINQLNPGLERAWELERGNKEIEALFERDEPNED